MWTEKTPSGKTKFIERYHDPLTGKTKRVSVVLEKDTASTRKRAQMVLNEKIQAALDNSLPYTQKNDLRLSDLIQLYRKYQKQTVTASTYSRNYYATETMMRLLNGDILVSQLSAGYVKAHFATTGDKPSTINERYTRFKALMRWAYENDYVSDISYLAKLKPLHDKEKKEKLQNKYMEKHELQQLCAAIKVPRWQYLTKLLALSGMRCGEAIALELSDVDIENGIIHVTKTFDAINNIVTSPKTLCSIRDIDMQPELLALCKDIRSYSLKQRLRHGYRSNLFLCDINGQHLQYFAYNRYIKKKAEEVIGRGITTHVLRHTHVSLMAEAGYPLEAITRRVGHENSKITREVYLHVTDNQKKIDREMLQYIQLL